MKKVIIIIAIVFVVFNFAVIGSFYFSPSKNMELIERNLLPLEISNLQTRIESILVLTPFADGKYWLTMRTIKWKDDNSDRVVNVPAFFVTDFASDPWLFRREVASWGRHGTAAIIHDFLYWDQKSSRETADDVMYEVIKEFGVKYLARVTIFAAVRLFGWEAWKDNRHYKREGRMRLFSGEILPKPYETYEEFEKRIRISK